MSNPTAKVVLDSAWCGNRIVTMHLRHHRRIHAQFLRHRHFSINARSSRAVPYKTLRKEYENDPALPVSWNYRTKGMVHSGRMERHHAASMEYLWGELRSDTLKWSDAMAKLGVEKSKVNCHLEAQGWIDVLVTFTDLSPSARHSEPGGFVLLPVWENFMNLRLAHPAEEEIFQLAKVANEALQASTPVHRAYHLPYVEEHWLMSGSSVVPLVHASAARCARISYVPFDEQKKAPDLKEDAEKGKRLLEQFHMSPFEHPSIVAPGENWANKHGWKAARHWEEFEG